MRKKIIFAVVVVLAIIGVVLMLTKIKKPTPTNQNGSPTVKSNQPSPAPSFDKSKYSINDPTSLWVVVNKPRALNPISYAPSDLRVPQIPLRVPGNESMQVRKDTATALETMFAAAKTERINLMLSSGYRSYSYQVSLYNGYVQSLGKAAADQQSARPGHSEHQTGLAADIEPTSRNCEVEQCFANTKEGQWLAANAFKFGFIIRYSADKVAVTGYEYEPWHVRYVGVELATEMHNKNIKTLEEFFNVPGGPSYN